MNSLCNCDGTRLAVLMGLCGELSKGTWVDGE